MIGFSEGKSDATHATSCY